ncbi:MAG: hypothetical protein M3305_15605 [Actinomycetota bacterium]|nr:hypothetical protein [Actinomycetota bacterium]
MPIASTLAICQDLENAEGVDLSLLYLGRAAHLRGDGGHSNTLLKESQALFKDLGDSRGVAGVLLEMGRVARRVCRPE